MPSPPFTVASSTCIYIIIHDNIGVNKFLKSYIYLYISVRYSVFLSKKTAVHRGTAVIAVIF